MDADTKMGRHKDGGGEACECTQTVTPTNAEARKYIPVSIKVQEWGGLSPQSHPVYANFFS